MVLYSFGGWSTEEKEKGASVDTAPTMNQIKHDLLHHRIFIAAYGVAVIPALKRK